MRAYALLMLLLCSINAISQNCNNTLIGTVVDIHDGSLLIGATVIIAGTEQATQTDLDGKFSFNKLCNGITSIQISHPNCLTKGYSISMDGNVEKVFRLEHHLEELNQVMIAGEAAHKSRTISESKIPQEKLENYTSGSLGDALNSLSGVSSLNTGNTVVKPLINGLHSSRVVIINNGVRMEDQEWGAEHAPNVDVNSVGKLTVIKGAGALQYGGDAVGGVVIAESERIPIKDSLYGKSLFTGATNGRGTSFSSQLTKSYHSGWHGKIQGTLKRFGDFEAPDYILSNTGAFERNASVSIGLNRIDYGVEAFYSYFKNEIGILSASHLGAAEDQVRAINSDKPLVINNFTYTIKPPKQDVSHHLMRIKAFKKFERLGKLEVQYDYQKNNRLEFDIRRGDDKDTPSVDLQLDTHTLKLDLESHISESTNLKTGISGRFQKNFADPSTKVRRLIPDYSKYDLGVFAIAAYRLDQLLFEVGGRFDYTFMDVYKFYRKSFWELRNYDKIFPDLVVESSGNQILTKPQLSFYNTSATAGTTYNLNEDYKLFFNYSLAMRAPNPSELFSEGLHHSASRIELGDLRFTSETAHKISVTFQKQSKVFNFSINPYINTIKDFIVIEPTGIQQTLRGNFQVWEYRQTNAQLLGVDVDASYSITKNLTFSHQFSLVKGYDRTMDEPLISMPATNTKNEISYQNSKLNNFRLVLQSHYVFRQNEFPNNNFETFIPYTQTFEMVDVSTPPNAYHLLNLHSSIDFNIQAKSQITVGLAITNLLDTQYRNYLNRLRYYADDLGRNFLLNLKINY